jgi:hypothetical protein
MGASQSQLHQEAHEQATTAEDRSYDEIGKTSPLYGSVRLPSTSVSVGEAHLIEKKMLLKLQPKSLDHGLSLIKSRSTEKANQDNEQGAVATPSKIGKGAFRFTFKPSTPGKTPQSDKNDPPTPGSALSIKSMKGKLAKKRKGTPNLSKIPTVTVDAARPLQVGAWIQ